MIRRFTPTDLRRFKPNQFSKIDDVGYIFEDDEFSKHTLVDENSVIQCIIVFRRYWQNNWLAFFLMADDVPAVHARSLKRFIHEAIEALDAKRVQTDSVDCALLNKWHEFLGFTLEGTRRKMINDQDYRMWAIVRD